MGTLKAPPPIPPAAASVEQHNKTKQPIINVVSISIDIFAIYIYNNKYFYITLFIKLYYAAFKT